MTEKSFTQDVLFNRKYSWIGILVVCLLSIPLHFTYDWLGQSSIVGMFTPINESIWEHLKLVFWPLLFWWGTGFLIFRNRKQLSFVKWSTAGMVAIIISMTFIVGWYYTWVYGLGIESSIIDIGSLFIAVPVGQLVGIHLYRVLHPRLIYQLIAILFAIGLGAAFIYFTFVTPDRPIFIPAS